MVIALFAIIGAIDNLYASYKSRRDEFVLYYQAGMSLKCIRKMKFFETAICLAFGIVLGLVFSLILIVATNQAFYAFSHVTLLNILYLFKSYKLKKPLTNPANGGII